MVQEAPTKLTTSEETPQQVPSFDPFATPSEVAEESETTDDAELEVSEEEAPAGEEAPAPLPENWHEREEVVALKKDSHAEGWRQGYSKADQVNQSRNAASTDYSKVYDGLQDLIQSVEKVAENGGLLIDDDRARRQLADLLSRSEALSKAVQISEQSLRGEGEGKSVQAFLGLASSNLPETAQEEMSTFTARLVEDTKVGIAESKDFWPSLFAKRDELVAKDFFEAGRLAGIEAAEKAVKKSTSASARRTLKGPEPKTGGSTSASGPSSLEELKALTPLQIAAFTDAQKAQMEKLLTGKR